MLELIEKAGVLIEALPYIRRFRGKTVVIKYGGKAMVDEELKKSFALDVVLLKYVGLNPVIIHGGGPQINVMLERLGMQPKFKNGLRVTDKDTVEVVEMVLAGIINKEIVSLINCSGGSAVGLAGKDGEFITARKLNVSEGALGEFDIGQVGEVDSINPLVVSSLQKNNFIPVISPVASDKNGVTFNINADRVASAVASSLGAEKLVLLTDINGVKDSGGKLLRTMDRKDVNSLIKDRTIQDGMLEKVNACMTALEGDVGKVHIIDGRIPHAILLEIFTDEGIGTEIVC